jgi:hypothetical protein
MDYILCYRNNINEIAFGKIIYTLLSCWSMRKDKNRSNSSQVESS